MRRRDFISLAGGTAVTWPLVAHAQQPERIRRLGILSSLAETDTEAQAWDAAFRKRLVELGWIDGRSVHIDYRRGAGSVCFGARPSTSTAYFAVKSRTSLPSSSRPDLNSSST
jgi:hypothetical protein